MKTNTAPARGMRDLLPAEVERRDHAAAVIMAAYERFGYRRVETPALEHIGLLCSGEGGDNEKLIYKVMKRGDKLDLAGAKSPDDLVDFGLRYDLTVPLARFYAEHAGELPKPFRAIQIGPVWRAERPQKGRYRQFTQCDIDVLGEESILAEVELIRATVTALSELGLKGLTVRLNDRRLLAAFVQGCGFQSDRAGDVLITIDKLDKSGVDGVRKELSGKGHEAAAIDKALTVLTAMAEGREAEAFEAYRLLCTPGDGGPGDAAVKQVENDLLSMNQIVNRSLPDGTTVTIDPTLVRGMGYYTGAIFEVLMEGYPFSMAGGGRYDKMIGRISGRDVPACGFSIGFERVVMVLEDQGLSPPRIRRKVALLYSTEADIADTMGQASTLRDDGHSVTVVVQRKKLGKQIDELKALGYDDFCVPQDGKPLELRSLHDA